MELDGSDGGGDLAADVDPACCECCTVGGLVIYMDRPDEKLISGLGDVLGQERAEVLSVTVSTEVGVERELDNFRAAAASRDAGSRRDDSGRLAVKVHRPGSAGCDQLLEVLHWLGPGLSAVGRTQLVMARIQRAVVLIKRDVGQGVSLKGRRYVPLTKVIEPSGEQAHVCSRAGPGARRVPGPQA